MRRLHPSQSGRGLAPPLAGASGFPKSLPRLRFGLRTGSPTVGISEDCPFLSNFEQREVEAKKQGYKQGLLEGIQALLSFRLPDHEKDLMARLERVNDPERLERFLEAATTVGAEELTNMLP